MSGAAKSGTKWDVEVTFLVVADSEEDAADRVREVIDGRLDYWGLIVAEGES